MLSPWVHGILHSDPAWRRPQRRHHRSTIPFIRRRSHSTPRTGPISSPCTGTVSNWFNCHIIQLIVRWNPRQLRRSCLCKSEISLGPFRPKWISQRSQRHWLRPPLHELQKRWLTQALQKRFGLITYRIESAHRWCNAAPFYLDHNKGLRTPAGFKDHPEMSKSVWKDLVHFLICVSNTFKTNLLCLGGFLIFGAAPLG